MMRRPPFRLSTTALCVLSLAPTLALADTPTQLDTVFVNATRSDQNVQNLPPSVDLVSREELNRRQASDLRGLLQDEPGVAVAREPGRRGNAGVTIRGIDGNRILNLIDGVRQPDRYQGGGGNGAISGGDYTEAESLTAVEIVKGPASSLYGSDAIGGILSYRTLSPSDFVDSTTPFMLNAKVGAHSADDSVYGSLTAAAHGEMFSGLVQYVRRDGNESENQGDNNASSPALAARRTAPNLQDWQSENWLAKIGFAPNAQHQFYLTYEHFTRDTDTDVITNRSVGSPQMGSILQQLAHDEQTRQRISLSHEWQNDSASWVQAARWRVYRQTLDQTEQVAEHRKGPGAAVRRDSDYRFSQTLTGFDGQLESRFQALGAQNRFIYGLDLSRTESERLRDRTQFNANGSTSKMVAGEPFPHKAFPDNRTDRIGVFAENRMTWNNGITLTPGLRFDRYELKLSPDALSQKIALGQTAQNMSASSFSPKLALSYAFNPQWTGFAQVSTGFRAPPFDDATLAFNNVAHGYEVRPNPNLKAEKSRGVELGLKHHSDSVQFGITAFANRYSDFLERKLLSVRMNHGRPFMSYQFQNSGNVRIYGAEVKAAWQINPRLSLSGALAWAHGDNRTDDTPLSTIDPVNGYVRLAWNSQAYGADATVRFAAEKRRAPAGQNQRTRQMEAPFTPPGYGVVDLTGYWNVNKHLRVNAGVYNALDKKYWNWADVKGFARSQTTLDFYTRPGRSFAATVDYSFF